MWTSRAGLLAAATLLIAGACQERCSDDDSVGGGKPGFEVGVHVHVVSAHDLLGTAAHRDAALVLGLDGEIVAQTDATRPMEILIGVGAKGVETHSALRAAPDAQKALERAYDLEPLMLKQVRIKPHGDRARCMFISDHIACASGEARLGRGSFAVEKKTRIDAGVDDPHTVLSIRVTQPKLFVERLWPALRDNLGRALTKALTHQRLRDLALNEAIAQVLAGTEIRGEVREDDVLLNVSLPFTLPASWSPAGGAPILAASPGFVALSWCDEDYGELSKPLHAHLADGRAVAIRIRDGAEVSLYAVRDVEGLKESLKLISPSLTRIGLYGDVLTASKDAEAGEEASKLELGTEFSMVRAKASIDMAVVGGTGHVDAIIANGAEGRTAVLLQMKRATFLSLVQVLTTGAPALPNE